MKDYMMIFGKRNEEKNNERFDDYCLNEGRKEWLTIWQKLFKRRKNNELFNENILNKERKNDE